MKTSRASVAVQGTPGQDALGTSTGARVCTRRKHRVTQRRPYCKRLLTGVEKQPTTAHAGDGHRSSRSFGDDVERWVATRVLGKL
jgi:hypothetical protein